MFVFEMFLLDDRSVAGIKKWTPGFVNCSKASEELQEPPQYVIQSYRDDPEDMEYRTYPSEGCGGSAAENRGCGRRHQEDGEIIMADAVEDDIVI